MMAYSEDHIALAAEYALGTLDADERAQVETMMALDTEFTAIVQPGSTGSAYSTRWSARSSRGRSCGRTSTPRSAIPPDRRRRWRCRKRRRSPPPEPPEPCCRSCGPADRR